MSKLETMVAQLRSPSGAALKSLMTITGWQEREGYRRAHSRQDRGIKEEGIVDGRAGPLWYVPDGRSLSIVAGEAAIVRNIFERYLATGSVRAVVAELAERQIHSRRWTAANGKVHGGTPFQTGAVRHLLSNPIYVGQIPHRKEQYAGLYQPIIDRAMFDAVQPRLNEGAAARRQGRSTAAFPPWRRKIFDQHGRRMAALSASKGGGRFRYYVSPVKSAAESGAMRVPSVQLETAVAEIWKRVFDLEDDQCRQMVRVEVRPTSLTIVAGTAGRPLDFLHSRLKVGEKVSARGNDLALEAPIQFRRWRGSTAAFTANGGPRKPLQSDTALIRAMARAHAWRAEALRGRITLSALAAREGVGESYLWRLMRLAYISPDLVRRVLSGECPPGLSVDRFMRVDLQRDWTLQRRQFDC